jgi:hypothetical protein
LRHQPGIAPEDRSSRPKPPFRYERELTASLRFFASPPVVLAKSRGCRWIAPRRWRSSLRVCAPIPVA